MTSAMVCRSCMQALRHQTRLASSKFSLHPRHASTQPTLNRSSRPSSPHDPYRPRSRIHIQRYASTTAQPAPPSPENDTTASSTDPRTSKPSSFENITAQETTETLFKECARQADYIIPQAFEATGSIPKNDLDEDIGQGSGVWYETFGLAPTFNTWAQITFLHMYLLTVRLRYFETERCKMWLQHLHDHFFFEAEHRMALFHKIDSAGMRQRYLKELFNQWRGVQGAYDEGLIKGDAVLAGAVWRNVFRAGRGAARLRDPDAEKQRTREELKAAEDQLLKQGETEFDWRRVACVVAFMRRGLSRLDAAPDSVILSGKVRFGNPVAEWESVVGIESRGVKARFDAADDEALMRFEKGEKDSEDGQSK